MVNGARSSINSSLSLVVVEILNGLPAPTPVTMARYPRIKPFLASCGRSPQLSRIEVELSARTEKFCGAAAGTAYTGGNQQFILRYRAQTAMAGT